MNAKAEVESTGRAGVLALLGESTASCLPCPPNKPRPTAHLLPDIELLLLLLVPTLSCGPFFCSLLPRRPTVLAATAATAAADAAVAASPGCWLAEASSERSIAARGAAWKAPAANGEVSAA